MKRSKLKYIDATSLHSCLPIFARWKSLLLYLNKYFLRVCSTWWCLFATCSVIICVWILFFIITYVFARRNGIDYFNLKVFFQFMHFIVSVYYALIHHHLTLIYESSVSNMLGMLSFKKCPLLKIENNSSSVNLNHFQKKTHLLSLSSFSTA